MLQQDYMKLKESCHRLCKLVSRGFEVKDVLLLTCNTENSHQGHENIKKRLGNLTSRV